MARSNNRINNNTSNAEQLDMVYDKLIQFGFNDIFNVVAYSVMGVGKYQKNYSNLNSFCFNCSNH